MIYNDFINSIKKVDKSREHKIKNSYGVYDGFKYYRKHRIKEPKYALNESQYFSIIRKVNTILGDLLLHGEDITFPYKMGRVELRKSLRGVNIKNNKLVNTYPIDWDSTLKLWYEDIESYQNKTLIRNKSKEVYRSYYNKSIAEYNNKSFYQFTLNRDLKNRLKKDIIDGEIDAFLTIKL